MGVHQQYAKPEAEISKNFKFNQFQGYPIPADNQTKKSRVLPISVGYSHKKPFM